MIALFKKVICYLVALCLFSWVCVYTGPAYANEKDDTIRASYVDILTEEPVIVDWFNDIPAYYSADPDNPYDCLELVSRYYQEKYNTFVWFGYVNWPESDRDRDMRLTDTPQVGDVLYWAPERRGKDYPHYAIVKEVKANSLVLIEQNWQWKDNNGILKGTINREIKYPSTEGIYDIWTYDPQKEPSADLNGKPMSRFTRELSSRQAQDAERPSDWAISEIKSGIASGLIPVELQTNYTQSVTREKVAQLVVNLLEKATGKTVDAIIVEKGAALGSFSDTKDKNILVANALGIITGTGDGKFSPNATLTRAQFAAIISRTATVLGYNLSGYPAVSFTDTQNHWVKTELAFSVAADIFNGVGNNKFAPDTALTVEQLGVVAVRTLNYFKAKS